MYAERWLVVLAVVCGLWRSGEARGAAGGLVRLWSGAELVYAVESAALANEAARKDQEVGWRLAAELAVRPVYCQHKHGDDHDVLLHFELRAVELQCRGAARHAEWVARPSVWDAPAHRRASFYGVWRAGVVSAAFLDPSDPPAIAGYKRALISLFQFQIIDGERNETDVSGDCEVLYETINEHEFRKIKKGCQWGPSSEAGAGVGVRRVTRYTLGPALDAVAGVHAEEVVVAGASGGALAEHADAAVKFRAWTRLSLSRAAPAPACAPPPADLPRALRELAPHLHQAALPLPQEEDATGDGEDPDTSDDEDEDAPLALGAALRVAGAGGGGDDDMEAAARRLLRVLPAVRAASARELHTHLHHIQDAHTLRRVAVVLGAAGTGAAHEAAARALQLRGGGAGGGELQGAAGAYLAALGVSARPHAAAVRAVLALAAEGADPRLRTAALLSAAAAAPRACPDLAASVRDHIAKHLARCKEEECRCVSLSALGNLRRADTGELLVEHAERGAGPRVTLAALRALAAAPAAALPAARVPRLLRLALNESRALEERAAALELAARRAGPRTPHALLDAARLLHRSRHAHAPELRRLLWQRLHALSAHHAPAAEFLRAARADPELGSWHARATHGTSHVLYRRAGWGAGGWEAALDSVQAAAGGVLRRGEVTLALEGGAGGSVPALQVELWTRGMSALAGGGGDEDEQTAAGLELAVAGARLPSLTLFNTQAELLSAVWGGAGSEPTPVLRAQLELSSLQGALPSLAGVRVRVRAVAAAALAMDAHATVSLWSRTASARLTLHAAVAGHSALSVRAPWGHVSAHASAGAPAHLDIAADLDFYSAVALCVRARIDTHQYTRAARLRSVLGARRWRVSRRRGWAVPRAGRTLALGADNDRHCRTLAPAD